MEESIYVDYNRHDVFEDRDFQNASRFHSWEEFERYSGVYL